jgi:hypothetical protein
MVASVYASSPVEPLPLGDARQGVVGEALQLRVLAEEVRLVGRHQIDQRLKLPPVRVLVLQQPVVVPRVGGPGGGRPAGHAGLEERELLVLEHQPRPLVQQISDQGELFRREVHCDTGSAVSTE